MLQTKIHEKGRPKWLFLKQNNLTVESHPAEWFFSLLPEKKKHSSKYGSGFEPFTTADTKHYIGLMMLHGLTLSPQMSYKFHSQESDPMNGNNLVPELFRKNAEKKLKMWKLFFGVQDPRKATPSRKTHPY